MEITAEINECNLYSSYSGSTDYVLLIKSKNCNCGQVINKVHMSENAFLIEGKNINIQLLKILMCLEIYAQYKFV